MRELTFQTYLKRYIKIASGLSTLSVHRLSGRLSSNYRLTSCLILYCALSGRQELLNRYTSSRYAETLSALTESNFLSPAFDRYEFKKIYQGYEDARQTHQTDLLIKAKARENLLLLMKQKGITVYRICKDLSLNMGNVNAYLSKGDCTKVSLALVHRIHAYLKAR